MPNTHIFACPYILEAMVTALFPNSSELAQAWVQATDPSEDYRIAALKLLILARDQLPGPVFFTVPTGGFHLRRPLWRDILEATRSYCNCPARRVLWPESGRTRMIPSDDRPRKLECQSTFVVDFYNAEPLVIAPYGGDLPSAYMFLTFEGDQLLVKQQPFLRRRDLGARLIRNSTGKNYTALRPDRWQASPRDLKQWVRQFGEVAFQQVVPLETGVAWESWLPTCSIIGVEDLEQTSGGWRTRLTIELDATVRVLPYNEDAPQHVCNPAIPQP